MNISKIKYKGTFDRIKLDSIYKSMYKSDGITIELSNINEDYAIDSKYYTHSISNLIIRIYGEKQEFNESDKLIKLGLKPIKYNKSSFRYQIATVKVIILKGDYLIPLEQIDSKSEKAFSDLAESPDELNIYLVMQEFAEYLANRFGYDNGKESTVGLIDKVYVHPYFRRLGISTWIHNNIYDIIKIETGISLDGIVLQYGDFLGEAEKSFDMTKQGYRNMLREHYKSAGYKDISDIILDNSDIDTCDIMYSIN